MRWAGHVARIGGGEMQIGFWLENQKELGRPRRRWESTIKMELRETGWCDVEWIDLAQDRDKWRALMNTVMNLRFP
jgi:hypothetical protein